MKGNTMLRPIDDEFRNIMRFASKISAAQKQSTFRYIVANETAYKIFGTNDVRDFLKPQYFKNHFVFDRQEGIELKPEDLARRYIGTLNGTMKQDLLLEMMVHYLV